MKGQTNKIILQGKRQRALRRNMTDAERKLWSALRGKQLQGLKFRRQHPYEDFILDFVCLEKKLVVEVDGGQHQDRIAVDSKRTSVLEHAGFRVIRFWNHEVLQQLESVVEKIWQEVSGTIDPSPPKSSP